jgi:hypothetical protein
MPAFLGFRLRLVAVSVPLATKPEKTRSKRSKRPTSTKKRREAATLLLSLCPPLIYGHKKNRSKRPTSTQRRLESSYYAADGRRLSMMACENLAAHN